MAKVLRDAKASDDAKAPDLLADDYAADDDGWLDKIIADEEETDRTTLWRLGSWGLAAVAALTLGLLSGQLPGAAQRTDAAATELSDQTQRLEGLERETGTEVRRLAAAIDTLNQDRDRLFSRMTTVEQGLDSVTGSIAKPASPDAKEMASSANEKASPSPAREVTAPPAFLTMAPLAEAPRDQGKDATKEASKETPRQTPNQTLKQTTKETPKEAAKPVDPPAAGPQPKPVAETAIKKADRAEIAHLDAAATKEATSDAAATPQSANAAAVGPQGSNAPAGAESAAGLAVARPLTQTPTAPTPPAAIVSAPLPALPVEANASDAPAEAETPVERTQFGLDLGGASSMAGLRALWNGVRKSHATQLGDLHPLLAIKPGKNGLGLQVHVIAGPITDAATAARLCALLIADERDCETAVYDGQRLVLDSVEPKGRPLAPAHGGRHRQTRDETLEAPPASRPSVLTWLGVRQGATSADTAAGRH